MNIAKYIKTFKKLNTGKNTQAVLSKIMDLKTEHNQDLNDIIDNAFMIEGILTREDALNKLNNEMNIDKVTNHKRLANDDKRVMYIKSHATTKFFYDGTGCKLYTNKPITKASVDDLLDDLDMNADKNGKLIKPNQTILALNKVIDKVSDEFEMAADLEAKTRKQINYKQTKFEEFRTIYQHLAYAYSSVKDEYYTENGSYAMIEGNLDFIDDTLSGSLDITKVSSRTLI